MRLYPAWLFAACVILPACHESSGATDASSATAGNVGGGRGGTGGGSGTATGGGAGHSSQGDAGSGQSGMTQTEACQAAVTAQCERSAFCLGNQAMLPDCLRITKACPDYYFSADSTRTIAEVAACLDTLATAPCTDVVANLYPSCLSRGKRSEGAACAFPSQCQSGVCSGGSACSTCRANVAPGQSCSTAACQEGSFCDRNTWTCLENSALTHATQGQPCSLSIKPLVGCGGDLFCLQGSAAGAGTTCMPAPGAGQPCGSGVPGGSTVCAKGTACNSQSNTCALLGACGAGAPCGDASYCKADGQTCAARASVGEACGDPISSSLAPCLAPAICSSGRCSLMGGKGDTCDATHACDRFLSCVGGTCQPLSCPVDGGAG